MSIKESPRKIAESVKQMTFFIQPFGEAAPWIGRELVTRGVDISASLGDMRERSVQRLSGRVDRCASLYEVPLEILRTLFEDETFRTRVRFYRQIGSGQIREIEWRALKRIMQVI